MVLLIPRSAALVVAALAVLRVGASYIPVNPAHPAVQVQMRLQAARPLVICTDGHPAVLAELGDVGPVIDIGSDHREPAPHQDGATRLPETLVHPDSAVYVMFTSGTTGVPKGVCVPARALSAFLDDMDRRAPLPDGAICAWWTEPTFDVSVSEIFSAVTARGRLLVVPAAVRLEPDALARWLDERRVQAAYVPPFAIPALADHAETAQRAGLLLALRRLLSGVEPIAHETLRRIAAAVPGLQVIFGYGPTETTIWCTYYHADPSDQRQGPTPIGKPAAGTSAYVLDRYLAPVPRGAAGEIYIGGEYVTRGYLGRPAQTAKGYLPDPFHPGTRMYQTGDVARRDRRGDLYFLGRRDTQVKLNGVRIELGEVEAALGAQPGIHGAAAAVRPVNGQRVLVGYVVAGPDAATPRDLVASLRTRLSPALVPSVIVTLDRLPLTAHGKLDRAGLPDPSRPAQSEPPRGPIESAIAETWVQVLGLADPLGREDDFFALGGHSLLAEYAAAELGRRLDREVPVATLIGNPTVAEFAAVLERERPKTTHIPVLPRTEPDEAAPMFPLSTAQRRLWLSHMLTPDSSAYHMPIALRLRGPLDRRVCSAHSTQSPGRTRRCAPPSPRSTATRARWSGPTCARRSTSGPVRPTGSPGRGGVAAVRPGRRAAARAVLWRTAADDHVLLLVIHHIASDAWSERLLLRDLAACYRAQREGRPAQLAPIAVQPADFAAWEAQRIASGELDTALARGRSRLAGRGPGLTLRRNRTPAGLSGPAATLRSRSTRNW